MEGNTFFFQWEVALMEFLQAHMGSVGLALAKVFSMFGEELILILVLGFLYWWYDKEYGKFVGTNLLVAVVLNPLVKNIFLRRRPYFDNPQIQCLKPVEPKADIYDIAEQGYSFPSGHSMGAASTYGSIAAYKKSKYLTIGMTAIILLVGISRFCVGVHYPTDVFVGWALGIAVVFLVPFLQKKLQKRWLLYLILILCGLPGFFYCTSTDYYSAYGLMVGAFFGFLFEEAFVNFENTRKPLRGLLRVLGGLAIFVGLNTLLKLPFSSEFLSNGTFAAHLVRTCRYGIIAFLIIGVYPMIFPKTTAK